VAIQQANVASLTVPPRPLIMIPPEEYEKGACLIYLIEFQN
jgi:hypothetical protein